jgi:tRNA-dihydrouridine synthase
VAFVSSKSAKYKLKTPLFILAPMDDVTDTVFRRVVSDCAAPDLAITEFVNVDGLNSAGKQALMPKLSLKLDKTPVIAQLWGKNPDNFFKATKEVIKLGFSGVDINFGCPDKTIVKNGCCSAYILPENRAVAVEIIKSVQKAADGKLPVSVKTRLGFNEVDFSWHELLLKQKLDMLIIHGRTKKEMSKVPADWQKIAEIRRLRDRISPKTLIIGNGDVVDRAHGQQLIDKHGLDGVMIGRGVLTNPFAFSEEADGIWDQMKKQAKLQLFARHVDMFEQTWQKGERRFETLKKFAKLYVNGFDGASSLRGEIMTKKSAAELIDFLKSSPD